MMVYSLKGTEDTNYSASNYIILQFTDRPQSTTTPTATSLLHFDTLQTHAHFEQCQMDCVT